jgi:hypothetical protein
MSPKLQSEAGGRSGKIVEWHDVKGYGWLNSNP